MRALMIGRAKQFSPNSVERDHAILAAVAGRLRTCGWEIVEVSEDNLAFPVQDGLALHADVVLSMGRRPETLAWLKTLHVPVINSPRGVGNCTRRMVEATMLRIGTPMPPRNGTDGYWVKRGDGAAQTANDVVYCVDEAALAEAEQRMQEQGLDCTVSAHVRGDLVKFYAVSCTDFFYYCYPTDDGQTKFGTESLNGEAHHYPFDVEVLKREAARLAEALDVEVYGGDAIVKSDGSFCIIDFNDWPSFSRCLENAAEVIESLTKQKTR